MRYTEILCAISLCQGQIASANLFFLFTVFFSFFSSLCLLHIFLCFMCFEKQLDEEDFIEEQNSVACLMHMLHNDDPEEMIKVVFNYTIAFIFMLLQSFRK